MNDTTSHIMGMLREHYQLADDDPQIYESGGMIIVDLVKRGKGRIVCITRQKLTGVSVPTTSGYSVITFMKPAQDMPDLADPEYVQKLVKMIEHED